VTLLLDENLSPRLADALSDLYPGLTHVDSCGLGGAADDEVWSYAKSHELAIVSKDSDFAERTVLRGSPPKVIWLRVGNCSTAAVDALLRAAHQEIRDFLEHREEGCLLLRRNRAVP